MKTKPVDRNLAHNYLKKAEEFYGTMQDALIKKRWNAVASNAIHTGISSADSVAIFIKGLRSSSEKHEEVEKILKELNLDNKEINDKIVQIKGLLAIKNSVEYEEKLVNENMALNASKNAERLLRWAKEKLKR